MKKRSLAEKLRTMYAVATDRHDANGNEIPDPKRVELPAGFREPPTIQQMLHDALRGHAILAAQAARGEETLEDSMDFAVDGDPDAVPLSVHQVLVMQEEVIEEGAQEHKRQERLPKPPQKPAGEAEPKAPGSPPPAA